MIDYYQKIKLHENDIICFWHFHGYSENKATHQTTMV